MNIKVVIGAAVAAIGAGLAGLVVQEKKRQDAEVMRQLAEPEDETEETKDEISDIEDVEDINDIEDIKDIPDIVEEDTEAES